MAAFRYNDWQCQGDNYEGWFDGNPFDTAPYRQDNWQYPRSNRSVGPNATPRSQPHRGRGNRRPQSHSNTQNSRLHSQPPDSWFNPQPSDSWFNPQPSDSWFHFQPHIDPIWCEWQNEPDERYTVNNFHQTQNYSSYEENYVQGGRGRNLRSETNYVQGGRGRNLRSETNYVQGGRGRNLRSETNHEQGGRGRYLRSETNHEQGCRGRNLRSENHEQGGRGRNLRSEINYVQGGRGRNLRSEANHEQGGRGRNLRSETNYVQGGRGRNLRSETNHEQGGRGRNLRSETNYVQGNMGSMSNTSNESKFVQGFIEEYSKLETNVHKNTRSNQPTHVASGVTGSVGANLSDSSLGVIASASMSVSQPSLPNSAALVLNGARDNQVPVQQVIINVTAGKQILARTEPAMSGDGAKVLGHETGVAGTSSKCAGTEPPMPRDGAKVSGHGTAVADTSSKCVETVKSKVDTRPKLQGFVNNMVDANPELVGSETSMPEAIPDLAGPFPTKTEGRLDFDGHVPTKTDIASNFAGPMLTKTEASSDFEGHVATKTENKSDFVGPLLTDTEARSDLEGPLPTKTEARSGLEGPILTGTEFRRYFAEPVATKNEASLNREGLNNVIITEASQVLVATVPALTKVDQNLPHLESNMAGTSTNLEGNETHTNPLNSTFSSVLASTSANEPIVNQTGSTFSNTKTDHDATNLNQELGNQATSYNQKGSKFLISPNVTATLAHPTSLIPTTTVSDSNLATTILTTNGTTKTMTFSTSTNTINSKPTDTNLTHTQNFTPTTPTQSVIHSTFTNVNSNTNPVHLTTSIVSPNQTKIQTARISPGNKEIGNADKFVSRNTVDQRKLEFQRYVESGLPSYWNCSNETTQKSTEKENVARGEGSRSHRFVEVDKATREAITDLATSTWDFQRVGLGVDARGLTHRSMQVVSVQRIENKNLFYAYDVERKRMWSLGGPCIPVGQVQGSKGNVLTSRYLAPFMRDQLYDDINEHYLFHGTDPSLVDAIASNGLDPRISHCRNMLGTAIHFAESSTKSDQYTDRFIGRRRNTETQTMFLVRVLLGNVFLINEKHESVRSKDTRKLLRPPCIVCLQDFCNCPDQELYGSVMADGKWIFREFALYDKNLCYPEYLIKYRRL